MRVCALSPQGIRSASKQRKPPFRRGQIRSGAENADCTCRGKLFLHEARPSPSLSATPADRVSLHYNLKVMRKPPRIRTVRCDIAGICNAKRNVMGTDSTIRTGRSKRAARSTDGLGGISFADSSVGAAGDGFCLVEPIFFVCYFDMHIFVDCRGPACRAPTERSVPACRIVLSRVCDIQISKLKSASHKTGTGGLTRTHAKSTRASRKFLGREPNFTELGIFQRDVE